MEEQELDEEYLLLDDLQMTCERRIVMSQARQESACRAQISISSESPEQGLELQSEAHSSLPPTEDLPLKMEDSQGEPAAKSLCIVPRLVPKFWQCQNLVPKFWQCQNLVPVVGGVLIVSGMVGMFFTLYDPNT
ncbi:MAG: hypothetical protein ACYCOU_02450 [Sulfobacillus sp.]